MINKCQWFSGKIQRCHRWAPGSIPGWRIRYSVGGYHRSLSRSKPGFESPYRNSFQALALVLPVILFAELESLRPELFTFESLLLFGKYMCPIEIHLLF